MWLFDDPIALFDDPKVLFNGSSESYFTGNEEVVFLQSTLCRALSLASNIQSAVSLQSFVK